MKPANQKDFFDVVHGPYVNGLSERLQRKLKKFNIGFVLKKGETLHLKVCKLKHRDDPEERKML